MTRWKEFNFNLSTHMINSCIWMLMCKTVWRLGFDLHSREWAVMMTSPPWATQIQSFHVDAWGGGGSAEWHSVRQWVWSAPPWLKRTCRICDAVRGCHVSAAATRAAAAWTGFISGDHRISKFQQHCVFPESAWILHKTCCQQLSEGLFFFFLEQFQ